MRWVPRVKICGITRFEDASTALGYGADALGFLVGLEYANRDMLSPQEASALIRRLPPFATSVLVTHRTSLNEVIEICQQTACQNLQLHGNFPVARIAEVRRTLPHLKVIKAVHVDDDRAIDQAVVTSREVDGILLDTRCGPLLGGTGQTHDWSISRRIVAKVDVPVILAGGLTVANIATAIKVVQPWGVDVNTGVRKDSGGKSSVKMERFIRIAKSCTCAAGDHRNTPRATPSEGGQP